MPGGPLSSRLWPPLAAIQIHREAWLALFSGIARDTGMLVVAGLCMDLAGELQAAQVANDRDWRGQSAPLLATARVERLD